MCVCMRVRVHACTCACPRNCNCLFLVIYRNCLCGFVLYTTSLFAMYHVQDMLCILLSHWTLSIVSDVMSSHTTSGDINDELSPTNTVSCCSIRIVHRSRVDFWLSYSNSQLTTNIDLVDADAMLTSGIPSVHGFSSSHCYIDYLSIT